MHPDVFIHGAEFPQEHLPAAIVVVVRAQVRDLTEEIDDFPGFAVAAYLCDIFLRVLAVLVLSEARGDAFCDVCVGVAVPGDKLG